ncbi:MAG TPA: hypothetical protein PKA82_06690 [Pyrinomonadaceae bacterium]|mgnify:CR=1 FL=1|nr:hypothetical protein [Pyrinomonadaceae bacterium]
MIAFGLLIAVSPDINAQTQQNAEVGPIRSSAAFSVVLLRKTEIEADLVSFVEDYTEENPRVVDARFELASINKEIDRMFTIPPSATQRLTESTGKLILRKAELETEMNRLLRSYKADHPQVKRLAKKVEVFQKALKQIFG